LKSKKKRYNIKNYLKILEEIPSKYSFLSVDSKVFNYKSIYPIFLFNYVNKKGTWQLIQKNIKKLEEENNCRELTKEDIIKFLDDNSDIEFETEAFRDFLPDYYYFCVKNKIYCYGLSELNKKQIVVRFFFDIKEFIY